MNKTYVDTPQTIIDLRSSMPAVRDQGQKPLCLPFAASDSNSRHQGIQDHLSVEYLAHYACILQGVPNYDQGLRPGSVLGSLKRYGQPHESQWPYISGGTPGQPPSSLRPLYFADSKLVAPTLLDIRKQLDVGIPVIACLEITNQFFDLESPYIICDVGPTQDRHAVVVVGLGEYPGGEAFLLIRNSWGSTWGDGGHAWITMEFLTRKFVTAFILN